MRACACACACVCMCVCVCVCARVRARVIFLVAQQFSLGIMLWYSVGDKGSGTSIGQEDTMLVSPIDTIRAKRKCVVCMLVLSMV